MTLVLRLPCKTSSGGEDRRREFFSCAADGSMCLWDGRSLRPRGTLSETARGKPAMPLCATLLPGRESVVNHAIVCVGMGSQMLRASHAAAD